MPTLSPEMLADGILTLTGWVRQVHDPTMIKEGDTYHLFSTGTGIPTRCSQDMLVWETCGPVIVAYPEWLSKAVPGVKELWAPDIVFYDGKYYLYMPRDLVS